MLDGHRLATSCYQVLAVQVNKGIMVEFCGHAYGSLSFVLDSAGAYAVMHNVNISRNAYPQWVVRPPLSSLRPKRIVIRAPTAPHASHTL